MATDFFAAAKAARGQAVPCSLEHHDYCLNVLPPVMAPGFFGMGEPYTHEYDNDGTEHVVRHWCGKAPNGALVCCLGRRAEAATAFARHGTG